MAFDDLKHPQRERLVFLDRCLTWRGTANRRDLMERFGISPAQAALDFRLYIARAGGAAPAYDTARKTYVAAEAHCALAPASLIEAFDILGAAGAALPAPRRDADPAVIAALYQAMKAGRAIHVGYTSMVSGADEGQYIAPTAFTSDGETVHLRAYAFKHGAYRNYLPMRIDAASSFATRELEAPLPHDDDWHTLARITLRPRSGLSAAQAEAIRREYGFSGAELVVTTRKALEFYFDRRWGLDLAVPRLERAATEYVPVTDPEAPDVSSTGEPG